MMRMQFGFLLGMALLPQPLLGNGGGYFRGGVASAGDVVLFEPDGTEKIRIVNEQLSVDLGASAAEVEVRYMMRNETDQKVKVRFGFPVEETSDRSTADNPSGQEQARPDGPQYCQNYTISASRRTIDATWQAEPPAAGDRRFDGIAGWLVSAITFAPGEEQAVQIRFRSVYPFEEWSVSDHSSSRPLTFRYRLSTAAVWAGTIESGKITLRPAGIPADEVKVIKPVNRFKKAGDQWVWEFTNLEPTMADDLEIEAQPEMTSSPVDYTSNQSKHYVSRGARWSMSHVNYEISASSTLAATERHSYDADQVKSWSDREVWSEGAEGPGVGEWLELKPEVAKPMSMIEMNPGYFENDELFEANARPKKMKIELNGEHAFIATVGDQRVTAWIPIQGYDRPVKNIRLTFLEVWPGKAHEDLCVSRIRLHVRLDKKPKLAPVR